jgi:hypothetical protein
MAEIRIKVGASADASIESTFQKPGVAAARMANRVAKESAAAGRALALGIASGVKGAVKEMNRLHGEAQRFNKLYDQLGASRGPSNGIKGIQTFAKETKKAFDESARAASKYAAEAEKAMARASSATARAAVAQARNERRQQTALGASMAADVEGAQRWKSKYFTGVSPGRMGRLGLIGAARSVFGVVGRGIGFAHRMAADIAHGAGVETDPGAFVKSFVERQAKASDIAHSGYIPGATGPNGQRQNAADIQKEALSVATANAQDPTKVLEGLQKFVAITGDLATGRAIMGDMAKLTLATGSDMQNVVEAAGEVSAKLGDIPDKANVVHAVMRQIAGAGKMGAIEMRDFAAQLGKIAGYASRVEGGIDKNIGEMGLLMQVARQKGGAGSAAQAATSVGAFMETLATPAKLKKFEAITGRNPYTDATKTHLMNPEAILREALHGTGGDVVKLHEIFGKRAANISMGAANVYNEAGGGQKGDTALTEYFDKLRQSVLSLDDENKAAAEQMDTAASRAQVFNNKLQEIADVAIEKLLPVLPNLADGLVAAFGGAVAVMQELTPYLKDFGDFLSEYFKKAKVTPGLPWEISHLNTIAELGGVTTEDITTGKKKLSASRQDVLDAKEEAGKKQDNASSFGLIWSGNDTLDSLVGHLLGVKSPQEEANAAKGRVDKAEETNKGMEEAFDKVMKKVFAGTLKVEVVGGNGKLISDPHEGRAPVSQ